MRRPVCMIGLAFVIVILLYRHFNPYSRTFYGMYDGSTVTVTGQVDKKEYRISNEQEVLVLYLKEVQLLDSSKANSTNTDLKEENLENNTLNGKEPTTEITGVICYMQEKKEPKTGSIVCIKGKFREFSKATNPGEFDAAAYYQILNLQGRLQNGILIQESAEHDLFRERLYEWKQYMAGLLELCFAKKEASVMKAMLLGEKSQLDEEVKTLYQVNGVIHILSISGLHISILGMGLYKILCKLKIPKSITVFLAIGFMYCYGVMTGMSVSSIRAIMMFGFHVSSELCKRTYDML
ncbi:MAG: ComEC/Rec2 family competence protein, partial [Lachnospiraceae bacterium]|nr:ComEC/Rec2 family competence protein [Lachnospiraceae bacterium]